MAALRSVIKRIIPSSAWQLLRSGKRSSLRTLRRLSEGLGFTIARKSDYYSPLPSEFELERTRERWARPSALTGISYDIGRFKSTLRVLTERYGIECAGLPSYAEARRAGFGPGYPELDAILLYMVVRHTKPRAYFEVGSGLSTYYCSLAARKNAEEGCPLRIRCIEPHPFEHLRSIAGIEVFREPVQDVPLEHFQQLEAGDILFIDSSHVLRLDGDVPYLYLEVLPALKKGVLIHIHDIPFPYNTPYPPEQWVLGATESSPYWPMYWNEAMVLQAFLAFNDAFEITMSTPLLRHHDEGFLADLFPTYSPISHEPNAFSSIWLTKRA